MADREDAKLLRDPGLRVLLLALALLAGILLSHEHRITSDGIDHYVYLRSLAVDRDLDLANDYAFVAPRGESDARLTPLGRTGNAHPVGPAIAWAPFFLVADLLTRAAGRPPDGLGGFYDDAVAFAGLLYGWLGLVLLYRTASRESGSGPALVATLGIGFGTFLYFYLAYAPTMAHAPAFAAAALFVDLWLRPSPEGARRGAGLGAACGLVALMRWGDVLIALLWAAALLPRVLAPARWRKLGAEVLAFAATALLAFSPQMLVWKLLYGSWLTIPQGEGFIAGAPAWAGVLFSPRHGLFSWSPLLYLGAVGLLAWLRRAPLRLLGAAAFFLALARVNAGVADWWGGAAFGARRFDALLPVFGVGLAIAVAWLAAFSSRRPMALASALVAAFALWNALLASHFASGAWDYSAPVSFEEMGRAAVAGVDRRVGSPFSLPASIFEWWGSGRSPADWESLYMQRRHARWGVRMGLDERMFLEDGWSAPREEDGAIARRIVAGSAGFVIPLHGPRAYRFGIRVRTEAEGQRLRILVNDRFLGAVDVGPGWTDREVAVPADAVRSGRNFLRVRRPGEGPWDGELAVAGAWMEPD
ncbi:MAG TPA: hypothetical protein VFM88_02170 [Vicinamibacteria bacterium]|nr:hypothetical protein [Vicinamibacteria bacterium]